MRYILENRYTLDFARNFRNKLLVFETRHQARVYRRSLQRWTPERYRIMEMDFNNINELTKKLSGTKAAISKSFTDIVGKHPTVYCHNCGSTETVDAIECLSNGWPKCCGYTMSLDKKK